MKDNIDKIVGRFAVFLIDDNNNIVDKFEDNNLIMDLSKEKMAQILGKMSSSSNIDNLRIGGEGVKTGTIIPKDNGDGFNSTRTQLFSEENNSFTYAINFDPTGINGEDAVLVSETDMNTSVSSTVNVTSLSNTVKFVVTIPKENGNHGSVFSYSEAGLYIGNTLFAMKLFPTRVKTSSLKLVINWTIIF